MQAYYQEKGACIDDVSGVELLENGPVRWVLRVNRKFRRSTVQMDILVYAGSDQLIFDYTVDWHERNLFVKAEYPVDVNAKNASYEIQFGYVERPVHKIRSGTLHALRSAHTSGPTFRTTASALPF